MRQIVFRNLSGDCPPGRLQIDVLPSRSHHLTTPLGGYQHKTQTLPNHRSHSQVFIFERIPQLLNLCSIQNSIALITDGGQIIAGSGGQASPDFSFIDDLDTGMYFAGTNTIGFATGGQQQITIDSGGNLNVANNIIVIGDIAGNLINGIALTTGGAASKYR